MMDRNDKAIESSGKPVGIGDEGANVPARILVSARDYPGQGIEHDHARRPTHRGGLAPDGLYQQNNIALGRR